jgi:hypothetical protein
MDVSGEELDYLIYQFIRAGGFARAEGAKACVKQVLVCDALVQKLPGAFNTRL